MAGPEDTLGASCPDGGLFYVCEDSGFIGCCNSDPCKSDNGQCGDKDLEPMGFDQAKYNAIRPQDCFGSESGVSWFACTGTKNFPFMGCCAVNPCQLGECPDDELRRSKLSSNMRDRQVFLHGDDDSTTTSSSAAPSSTTLDSSSTGTTSSTAAATTTGGGDGQSSGGGGGGDSGLSQGAIIGISVSAAGFALAGLGIFLFWFWRRARRSREEADASSRGPLMAFGTPGAGGHESGQFPQDMKYHSQYSPNTASFHAGLQSPQSASFTHPSSPQPYQDRGSYHPGLSPSPGMQSPPPGMQSPPPGMQSPPLGQQQHQQWPGSPGQQGYLAAGGMYDQNKSPPAHVTSFNMAAPEEHAPVELPASMTQQSSELSSMSELPANPNTVSVQSYSGMAGRESEVSGISSSGRR